MGGVGDYTALLAKQLVGLGAEVLVLTNGPHVGDHGTSPAGPRVLSLDGSWDLSSWYQVASAALRHNCRIVHIQYQAAAYGMYPAANLLPGYLRLRHRRMRIVTTFHDLRVPYLFPKAGPLRRGAVRALDLLSHASVATNQPDLDDLGGAGGSKGHRPKRWLIPLSSNVQCAPPPDFDRTAWRKRWGAAETTLLLSYFGFMNQSKGVDVLVEAVDLLLKRGLDTRLLVVGGEIGEVDPTNRAYSEKVAQLIAAHGLGDRLQWTGFLPQADVSAALLSSDLCVLPFRDGASLRRGSLLAAIVHGLPVVSTFPERHEPLLSNGENVVMVERDNPSALAEAMERLWRDQAARHRLAVGAKGLSTHFRWPDIAKRHLEMYDSLLFG